MTTYQPFSISKNIDRMVRKIVVFLEEETLEATMLSWNGSPFPREITQDKWVKYVSTPSSNPREVYLYWDSKIEDEALDIFTKKLLSRPSYFAKLDRYFKKAYKDFEKFTDDLYKKGSEYYHGLSNKQLASLFARFNKVNKPALAAYYIAYDGIGLSTRLIKRELDKALPNVSRKEMERIFQTLSTVGINTVFNTERKEFLLTLKKIQDKIRKGGGWKDKDVKTLIFDHWYKFGACVYTDDTNKTFEIDDYKNKFLKDIKQDTTIELKKIHEKEQEERKKVFLVMAKVKKHPNLIKHTNWMRTMMGYRNREAEYYDNYFDHALDFFYEISRRAGIKPNDIWLLSKTEIRKGLLDKTNLRSLVTIRKRLGFTIKQVGTDIRVRTGVDRKDRHEINEAKSKTLAGNPAYAGKVKGKVRIVFNPLNHIRKFKTNEILVTSMTTPDFVPLMKKAKAVITDEGGVLCHAAIVAREMEKPCVIGTKVATKSLHTGDEVEVDAAKGVAKILTRA